MYPVYVKGIRTIYTRGLNKGFSLKFRVGSRVRYATLKESLRTHRPKRCEYGNKDEETCLNILNDKNDLTSSKKFKQQQKKKYFKLVAEKHYRQC